MMSLNRKIVDWSGQRVWIIGASSGIGAALATRLLRMGARVALTARNVEALTATADGASTALIAPADVTQPATIASAYNLVREAWSEVDLVVLMAGTYVPARAWELTAERTRSQIETNLIGVLDTLQIIVPDLIARGAGGVVIVSSVAGYRGLPRSLLYGPTKAALINLAESLYIDCVDKGVSVYLVNPGFVETPLTAKNDFKMPHLISVERAVDELIKGLAAGRFEIHFPHAFTWQLKFMRWFPDRLYFAMIKKVTGL